MKRASYRSEALSEYLQAAERKDAAVQCAKESWLKLLHSGAFETLDAERALRRALNWIQDGLARVTFPTATHPLALSFFVAAQDEERLRMPGWRAGRDARVGYGWAALLAGVLQ